MQKAQISYSVGDMVFGIDEEFDIIHRCQGQIKRISKNRDGEEIYLVQFEHRGHFILKKEQITKNIID